MDVLGLTIILPLLPFYAERMGASPAIIGVLIATYAACQLIAGPLLGRISDQVGRRPLLLVSQIGTFIGFIILALATQLWVVFVSRIIDGLTAGNLSLAQAYISDVTKPENRAKAFGMIGIAFGLGFLVGPGISGFLSQFGYTYPIYAAAGLSATSILCTYFLLPSNPPKPEGHVEPEPETGPGGRRLTLVEWGRYVEYFRRPMLGPLLWKFFAYVFSFGFFMAGFALFAERRYTWHGRPFGPKEVGYIFAYAGFLGAILQGGVLGRLVKRLGEHPLLAFSFISGAVGYGLLGFAYTLPQLIGVTTIAAFYGMARPVVTSLITQGAGRREQGTVLGLTQSLTSVAQITAPVIAGFLINSDLLVAWALTAAGVAVIGWLIRTPHPDTPLNSRAS